MVSGTRADRPGLGKAREMLREGDTLVVWKLDRFGRSVKQLVDLVGELHKQGVQFKSLTDAIDSSARLAGLQRCPFSTMSKYVCHIAASLPICIF